jgi:hypothetical protein
MRGTLKVFFGDIHNKKIPAVRQHFSVRGSISVTAWPRIRAILRQHCFGGIQHLYMQYRNFNITSPNIFLKPLQISVTYDI